MLVDRVRIRVTGGAGGNGCCSFRREKYVPRGGPDGGDGGDGGNVYFIVDSRYTSLLDLRYHAHWKGKSGRHGQGSARHGKQGEDEYIRVPPGTLVRDLATDEILSDLTQDGQRFVAAHGGKGGKGNARFASPTQRAPKFAELGEPGQDAQYVLEMKLIAEVGIVGLPNAGKSTLLASVTAARPKIDDYPFTTLSPNLGVASLGDFRTLTIADIPGIIEGAAQGKGLGHDFLRHIERTKVLLFLIDLGDADPLKTRDTLEKELAEHGEVFADKPRVYALNKADIPANRARFAEVMPALGDPFLVSAATREGIPPLLEHLWQRVDRLRREEVIVDLARPEREYTYEAPYEIEERPDGFRVAGKKVSQAVAMTDFENEEAVRHLQKRLQRMGVFRALKRMGAQEGATVRIGDFEFEYRVDG